MYIFYTNNPDMRKRHIYKILLIMRLTTVILIASMLQVSASGFGQKLNYVRKSTTLLQLFKEIKAQTGYHVVWPEQDINTHTVITANFRNVPVTEVLNQSLRGLNLTYAIRGRTIVIKAINPSLIDKAKLILDSVHDFFLSIDVQGRVVDDRDEPLLGAIVKVKGSTMATSTNAVGNFELKQVPENAILLVSYLGFETKEIKAEKSLGTIKLILAIDDLKEVEINAGYYTVKNKVRTGAISRVSDEIIAAQPVGNPLTALTGRMAGVNIAQSSGVAGGNVNVEIRGRNSLRSDARDPLYLVDGVPYPSAPLTNNSMGVSILAGSSPLNYLNPLDIESIEVLKDADATAIYGSRGANGVVLIKTKSARNGKTEVGFNIYTGISKVSTILDLLNTSQYLEMRNEAFKNDGISPGLTDYDLNGSWDQHRYTDWQDVLIGGTAQLTNISASINGGNEFTQVAFRSNYNRQSTVFPGNFADQKGSASLTAGHASLNKKFKANFSSSYLLDNNNLPRVDLTNHILLAPNAPEPYTDNGDLNWAYNSTGAATWTNPMAAIRNVYQGRSVSFMSSAVLSYEPVRGLIIKSNLGYTNIRLRENLLNPVKAGNPATASLGSNYLSNNTIETWIAEPQLIWNPKVFKGRLEILLGSTFQKDDQKTEAVVGTGYTNDLLLKSISAAPTKTGTSSGSQYKYNALFARLNYNHQDKYILNLTARRDGSSRFGPGKQFANFGAVGAAWIFSEEKAFRSSLPFLSFGKFRASYGLTGSDKIGDYGFLDTYSASQPYQGGAGLTPTRLANPDYAWENNKKLEAAVDMGFLRDKLFFTISWYRNLSSNQLVGYSLPDITGFTSIQYNLPAVVQNTGLEFELNTSNVSGRNFTWKTAFNLTVPRNELVSYPNIAGSAYASAYTVGQSLYTPIGYHYLGVDPQNGLYTFEDLDGNGNDLDEADKKTADKGLESHAFGGLQNSFTYKSFQLDVFFQFVSKTARNPISLYGIPGAMGNQSAEVMERWQKQGDERSVQKFSQSLVADGPGLRFYYTLSSDYFSDASFIRLKNVSFSWNVPADWSRRLRLKGLKLYLQGQNLFTLTKYKGDPEVLNIKSLPSLTTLTAGIQVSL
ncbi:SusC/RagA family TonB-linked outer membrane protein [Pedobacter heparinus]|uniref:TonB-dependent receptor plug n=1 Tax=Pedobacter heparinus (strain ATCC 13125 / DSM 2366 / CIP 104194 / JCM 7457 / NBRC 12017 / NCIMB 9290 / NRRL B-14731 / HIM 762-3) TaxID=485917 RepID=C6XVV5_PEDHD|nr:SusC/RagA family TonB-linked outer membrane protein [Pedobacter heparinus]ACU06180.1 TonB-dependent receptor plug [Pedobacter heparinus DSM 2366]